MKMNKKNRNKIMIVILILLSIAVGYAFLNTSLDFKGTTTIINNNFSIIFSNIIEKPGSVSANTPAKIDTENGTSIEFDFDLTEPGEYYGFSVDVKNDGQLNAMIDTVNMPSLTETQKNYLNFTILDDYGMEIQEKDLLKRGSTRTINILVEYRTDLTERPSSSEETISLSFDLKYVEADETAVDISAQTWENKTAVFVGDSITYGQGITKIYYQHLNDDLKLSSATGMGVGGSAISTTSDYGTSMSPLINRYTIIPDADLITVFMGTNDYGHETPLGTINDTTDISFYGALNVIVPALKNAHPNSRIVFITPIHRYGFGTSKILGTKFTRDDIENGVGATLEDYVNAIKEVCADNDIPVIDLFTTFPLDPTDASVRSNYFPDGLHPNDAGHEILANSIAKALKGIRPLSFNDDSSNEEITDPNETNEMLIGNRFDNLAGTFYTATNRISYQKNLYLTAGTKISLKNPSTYKFVIVKNQDSEELKQSGSYANGGAWSTTEHTLENDGWYGFAFARNDDADFNLGTIDPNTLMGYITIE